MTNTNSFGPFNTSGRPTIELRRAFSSEDFIDYAEIAIPTDAIYGGGGILRASDVAAHFTLNNPPEEVEHGEPEDMATSHGVPTGFSTVVIRDVTI